MANYSTDLQKRVPYSEKLTSGSSMHVNIKNNNCLDLVYF